MDCLLPGIAVMSHPCGESLQKAQLPRFLLDGPLFPPKTVFLVLRAPLGSSLAADCRVPSEFVWY